MIQKHAIPILEFDDNPQAVIMPNHEGLDLQLQMNYSDIKQPLDLSMLSRGFVML